MSKAKIADAIQTTLGCSGVSANKAAKAVIATVILSLKKEGGFTLPSFGTFKVRKTKARKALNPRTQESVKVKAGKTVRFRASPVLRKSI